MTHFTRRVVAWAGLATLLFCGCQQAADAAANRSTAALTIPGVIVKSEWLKQNLNNTQLIVVDAREPEAYEAGHIVGAVNIPMSRLFLDDQQRTHLASMSVVQQVLSDAGIDMNHAVVIYDGENFRAAASIFWTLEVHGHTAACVLEGNYAQWVQDGLPTTMRPTPVVRRQFVAAMQPERFATKLTVLRAINGKDAVILDARSDEEFRGERSVAARKGHIPSAINIAFDKNLVFNKEGTCSLQFSDDLVRLYRTELKDRGKVICYCNIGHRASVSYLALRALGYDATVYDGSWMEWGNDTQLPIQ